MAVVLGSLTAGVDTLRGGADDEIVIVPSNNANLAGSDVIAMGGGLDTLRFDRTTDVSIAPAKLTGISGVDVFDMTAASSIVFSISDAEIRQSDAAKLTLLYSASPMTLDLRSLTPGTGQIILSGLGPVTLMDAARQSVTIADGVNGTVTGGNQRDTLTGGSGNDVLSGLDGADMLLGGAGNDTLDGGAGFDVLGGGGGSNLVTGGSESDLFVVSAAETLTITDFAVADLYERIDLRALGTTAFSQLAITTQGADTLITIDGTTVLRLQGVTTPLTADNFVFAGDTRVLPAEALGVAADFAFTSGTDLFAGTAANETFELSGSSANLAATDVFAGGAGVDTLRLVGPDRSISAARLAGMSGVDIIDFTAATGTSVLSLDASVIAQTDLGVLTIRQGASALSLDTGVTAPSLAEAAHIILEGVGPVTLRATTAQALTISDLYAGNIIGGGRADLVVGGALADSIFGGDGDDTLFGGAGNDTLSGGAGGDVLDAGTGINTLTGGLGADQFVIVQGSETTITDLDVADMAERVDLRAFEGLVFADLQLQAEGNGTRITLPDGTVLHISNVAPQNLAADDFILAGQDAPRNFTLTLAADNFTGGTGDDVFNFAGNLANLDGSDSLNGGAGIDTLRVSGADRALSAARLAGLTSIEVIDLTATTGTNTVEIDQGLVARSDTGSILIRHGSAALSLDTSLVNTLGDVVVEGSGTVSLRNQPGQKLLISDTVAGTVIGGNDANYIVGGALGDTISGLEGSDQLEGGDGNDILSGGDGADQLDGGTGNDSLDGGLSDDRMSGGLGDDTLSGGDGYDLIMGGAGTNVLSGDSGSDAFVISLSESSRITDFSVSDTDERIDLRNFAGLTYEQLQITDSSSGAVVLVPGKFRLVLSGVSAASLVPGNFVFTGDPVVLLAESLTRPADFQFTAATDNFVGNSSDNIFELAGRLSNLDATDTFAGGTGQDILRIHGADRSLSADRLTGMSGIEIIDMVGTSGVSGIEVTAAMAAQSDTGSLIIRSGTNPLFLDAVTGSAETLIVRGTGLVQLRDVPGQMVTVHDATPGNIQGGNDGDLVRGGANNDRINGAEGNDTLLGGGGDDDLQGGDGKDYLVGGTGLDSLYGGNGDDTLVADSAHDLLSGGAGNDLYVIKTTAGITTVAGYETNNLLERIDLTDFSGVAGMANLTATQTGAHVTITAPDLNIVLQDTALADLGADDFLFSNQDPLEFHVDPSMQLSDIQHLLTDAPPGAKVYFAAGIYSITDTLTINRSDISLIGAGEGQTIFRTDIPDTRPAPTVLVQPDNFQIRLGVLAADAAKGTTQVTLQPGHGLAVGDILYVSQANDDTWLAETGNTGWAPPDNAPRDGEDYYLRETRSRIVSIDGDTATLAEPLPYSFAANVATAAHSTFLSNVTLQGFTVQGVWGEPDPYLFEITLPAWEGMSTVEIDGVTNSTIQNVSVLQAASHAFRLQRLYEVTGDHLTVDGAHNKDGGNGYSFFLYESFANTLTNLTSIDARHAVLFSSYSAEHYNNIHLLYSNRDINFHGSPDSGNTIVVDRLEQDYPAGSAPQFDAVQGGSFPLHPYWTIEANDVTFRYAVTGERDDRVVAHADGGYLSTGVGRDTLVGGAGNDTLDGGENADVMAGGAGRDTFIRQYADYIDKIVDFQAGTGGDIMMIQGAAYTSFAQLRLFQSGSDTILDFGPTGLVRFSNTLVSNFTAANFQFARDTAPGQTLTLRADEMFAVGTDRADLFNISALHTSNADFRVIGGAGHDTVAIAQQALSGNLFTTGSYSGIDRFDISRVSFPVITVDNRLAAQSDAQSLVLAVGDSGAAVSLNLQPLGAGRSIAIDGAREVRLTGGITHTVNATDRIGVNILGDTSTDVLKGGAKGDLLNGADGRDLLNGGLGDDTLIGGTGADTMYGGYGSDTFYVDNTGDIVAENRKWDGVDLVISSVDFLMGKQHIENLTLVGTGNIRGIGNGLENVVIGNSGANLIDGGPRNDIMIGGAGNDTYLVRDAGDRVVELAGEGVDTVRSFINYELAPEVENLYIQTNVALNGRGNALNNTIVGNNAANVISGREGNDILTGQGGADTFVFDRAASTENADRITDFQVDIDRLLFARSAYAGFAAGTFQDTALAHGTTAVDADDRLVYDDTTGRLWFDADGSGTGVQELVAVLTNRAAIDAGDIFLA